MAFTVERGGYGQYRWEQRTDDGTVLSVGSWHTPIDATSRGVRLAAISAMKEMMRAARAHSEGRSLGVTGSEIEPPSPAPPPAPRDNPQKTAVPVELDTPETALFWTDDSA